MASLELVFFFFFLSISPLLIQLVAADPPVRFCVNDLTKNVSMYLRATSSIDSVLDTFNSTLDYTAPPCDPPPFVVPKEFAAAASEIPLLEGSPLHKVRVHADSPEGKAQLTNLKYLLMLSVEDLVYSFRSYAGLNTSGGVPYGGWESPDQELRGHFVGHYLSATAKMWASTHNKEIKQRMEAVVDALAECQLSIGNGYVSAFPMNFFTRFETYHPVWAPYYTMHKIMAGLLDQYTEAHNEKALRVLLWMVQYFTRRIESYVKTYTVQAHFQAQNMESGGMNDVLYNLYRITGDPEHMRLAHLFDKPCFLGPLTLKQDTLSGFHVNTHLPIIIGAQNRYELTGEQSYKDLALFFMEALNSSHRFITGGTSDGEFWKDPNRMGTSLGANVEESCSSYNMLKIARNLFRWTRDVKYVDYYERLLINGVLTIQRGDEPGVMIYMLPMGHGHSKTSSVLKWGTPFDSFWCCYGTGIESFSKLGDSIYFEDHGVRDKDPGAQVPIPGLYVAQFISSTLHWSAPGLILNQTVKPLTSFDPNLEVTIEFTKDQSAHVVKASPFIHLVTTLNVRIPSWASAESEAFLNDEPQTISPGSFLTIQKVWKAGDKLRFKFPVTVTLEHVEDDREDFEDLYGIMFGAYVLAGMSKGDYKLGSVNVSSPGEWIVPVDPKDNELLHTFMLGGNQLGHRNGSLTVDHAAVSGTDWDFQATFKISTDASSVSSSSSDKVVTLELMDEPGKVVAHKGINDDLVVVDRGDQAFSEQNSRFKLVSGVSGVTGAVSLESENFPGCYVHAEGWKAPVQLKCRADAGNNTGFDGDASFELHKGLTRYHPMSFIAKGAGGARNYLLFPQSSYRDEHYNVYFDLK